MNNLKPCPFCGGHDVKVIAVLDKEHGVDCWLEDLPMNGGKANDYSVTCLNCFGNSGYRRTPQAAIDNWNRRPDLWIPITERLPEKGECLVVYSDGTVHIASVIFGEDFKHCTHWMPLPEPPKEVRP